MRLNNVTSHLQISNEKWGPAFFPQTTSRNSFTEITRFIPFDNRNRQSDRLQTDKLYENWKVTAQFLSIIAVLFQHQARYPTNINTDIRGGRSVIVHSDPVTQQSVSSVGRKIRGGRIGRGGGPPARDNAVQFSTESV